MASGWMLTDYTQEVLRQRDRMWDRDLERNLSEIRCGRLAARLAEISITPSARESARTAAILSAALPPEEMALRLHVLGVDERWTNAQVNSVWPMGISVQVGRQHCWMIGIGVGKRLAHSFPEVSVLWARANYNVGPASLGLKGIDVTYGSPSGTFPSEWGFPSPPTIPATISLTAAWTHYFINPLNCYAPWSSASVTDVTGESKGNEGGGYQIVSFSWNTMLSWIENRIGRTASAGSVLFEVGFTGGGAGSIRCGCYQMVLWGSEC